jgi:protein-S-isoprenylcysteine O-methyltransferase Ste14
MYYFNNFSTGMYLYLFLHGSYGIFWVIKDIVFPDASFKEMGSIPVLGAGFVLLLMYWMIPVTIASGLGIQEPSSRRIQFCIAIYVIGLILMLGSDYQKTTTLKKKKGLISTGFFARTRNPNYLG